MKHLNPMKHLNSIKHMNPMKHINNFKNKYFSQKNVLLFIILCVAIYLFTHLIRRMREGFTDEVAEATAVANADTSNDPMSMDYNSFYIAPAGNTVLYGKDKPHKHTKYCTHKKNKDKEPLAIPQSQIPDGDEDMYILKSEIVPPVCPACPNVTVCPNNGNNNAPPPCPPCARCPEPAFDCKKVPNYNSNNSDYLPRPVLADFSQFGM